MQISVIFNNHGLFRSLFFFVESVSQLYHPLQLLATISVSFIAWFSSQCCRLVKQRQKRPRGCSPKSQFKFREYIEVSRVKPLWSASSLGMLMLYCANSCSSDVFMHMILVWGLNGWFWGPEFLLHLSAMLILLYLVLHYDYNSKLLQSLQR